MFVKDLMPGDKVKCECGADICRNLILTIRKIICYNEGDILVKFIGGIGSRFCYNMLLTETNLSIVELIKE